MGRPISVADAAVAVAADFTQFDREVRSKATQANGPGQQLATAIKKDFGNAGGQAGQNFAQRLATSLRGGVQPQVSDMAKSFAVGTIAANLLSKGIGLVDDAIAGSIHAYQEQQVADAALVQSLRANVPGWNGNTDAIRAQNEALKNLGFTDTEATTSLTGLVGATHDLNEALKIQNVAADLARYKRISLQQASDALTKVEAGQFRILKSLGIQLDANATQTEALAAVEKVAGGQAQAYADTDLGKLEIAHAKVEAAQEKLGKGLSKLAAAVIPVVADAVSGLGDAVEFLNTEFDGGASASEKYAALLKQVHENQQNWLLTLVGYQAPSQAVLDQLKAQADATDALTRSQDTEKAATVAQQAAFAAQADELERQRGAVAGFVASVGKAMDDHQQVIDEAARWMLLPIGERLRRLGPESRALAASDALAIASGIRDKRAAITSAIDQLKNDIKDHIGRTKEVARDAGLLFGKTLADALRSNDPVVRKQAEGTRALIEERLLELGGKTTDLGKKAQQNLVDALHSKDPEVRAQAERTKSLLDAGLQKQTTPKTPGDAIGDQLATDLGSKGSLIGKVAYQLGRTIYYNLRAGVTGTGSVGSLVTVSGAPSSSGSGSNDNPQRFALGTDYVRQDMLAYIHKGEAVLNPAEADKFREGLRQPAQTLGGNTYQNTWIMPEAPTRDPFEVLERTSRYARWGRLNPEPAGG